MAYPQKPTNSLEIRRSDGTYLSLYKQYGMILLDGYDLGLPGVKSYVVDIPGGDGSLDITETVYGGTPLTTRPQTFNFMVVNLEDQEAFEARKGEILKKLHGHIFKYRVSIDPDYYYEGRFDFSEPSFVNTSNFNVVGFFSLSVEAKPYKIKAAKGHVEQICVGGQTVRIDNGRKKVLPTVELPAETYISFGNKHWTLGPGTFVINDLILNEGTNYIYFNSYKLNFARWSDLFRVNTKNYRPEGYEDMYKHIVYTNTATVLDHLDTQNDYKGYICTRLDAPKISNKTITWTTKGNYVGVYYSTNQNLTAYGKNFHWSIPSSKNPNGSPDKLISIDGPKWKDLENCTFNELMTLTGGMIEYIRTDKLIWNYLLGDEITWNQVKSTTWAEIAELEDIKQNVKQKPVVVEWEVGEI